MTQERRHRIVRIFSLLADVIEIYIPAFAFCVMIITFLVGIFFRYFLNNPLIWTLEVTIISFMWTALLGASYAFRTESHIWFGLFYESGSPKRQLVFRLLGNTIMLITFIILIPSTYQYLSFMHQRPTNVLELPYTVQYGPFLILIIMIVIRVTILLVRDIMTLVRKKDPDSSLEIKQSEVAS